MINDMVYYSPTKMVFSKTAELEVGKIIKEYGFKKVLIIYGKNSIIKSGLLDSALSELKKYEISYELAGGVEANPKVELVNDIINKYKNANIELILAIGGGSVIDTSKAVATAIKYDYDAWDLITKKQTPKECLPIGVILTLAAAGSEFSDSCILSNSKLLLKGGFNSPTSRPLFALMNPILTYSVSKYQTANGIVDIMMHTLERFFDHKYEFFMTDQIAISILKTVVKYGIIAYNNPTDYEARSNLMISNSFSHNGLTVIGKASCFRVHKFEHALSGLHDEISHGAGLAVLFIAWAKVVKEYFSKHMAVLAVELFKCDPNLPEITLADMFISKIQEYYQSVGMPSTLRDFGIKEEELETLALMTSMNKTFVINDVIDFDYDKILEVFKVAY